MYTLAKVFTFPSPYGVSFILMGYKEYRYKDTSLYMFPSPYGVSFILMKNIGIGVAGVVVLVSVSLRSIIHSYFKKMINL